jgi:hypothetical protein
MAYEEMNFPEGQVPDQGGGFGMADAILPIWIAGDIGEGYALQQGMRNSRSFTRMIQRHPSTMRWRAHSKALYTPKWASGPISRRGKLYASRAGSMKHVSGAFRTAARALGKGRFGLAATALSSINKYKGIAAVARLGTLLGHASWAIPLVQGVVRGVVDLGMSMGKDYSRMEFGTNVYDTQEAQTQRQAALAAIHNSQLQTRSMFMREAQAFHQ